MKFLIIFILITILFHLSTEINAQSYKYFKEISGYSQNPPQYQFELGSKIAIDKNDNIFICNTFKNCIIKLNSKKEFVKKWYGIRDTFSIEKIKFHEKNENIFNFPYGIAVDKVGNIFVADTYNNRVLKFDNDGNYLLTIQKYNNSNIERPNALSIDGNGNIYVVENNTNSVIKFDLRGKYLSKIDDRDYKPSNFEKTRGNGVNSIAIDQLDNVYLLYSNYGKILKFNKDGKFIDTISKYGEKDGEIINAEGLFCNNKNYLYVGDSQGQRIQVFDENGKFLRKIGSSSDINNKIIYPETIVVDSKGHFYTLWNGLAEFDNNGEFVKRWGSDGRYDSQFIEPNEIFVGKDNFLYVSDDRKFNIHKFDIDGNFHSLFSKNRDFTGNGFSSQDMTEDIYNNFVILSSNSDFPMISLDREGYFLRPNQFYSNVGISNEVISNGRSIRITKNVETNNQEFWVTKFRSNKIKKLHYMGYILLEINSPDSLTADLEVLDFAFDSQNNIIASYSNGTIQKFNPKGEFLNYIIKSNQYPKYKTNFISILVLKDDSIVASNGECNIMIMNELGEIKSVIGTCGTRQEDFNIVGRLAISNDEKLLFATDRLNQRIQVFKLEEK